MVRRSVKLCGLVRESCQAFVADRRELGDIQQRMQLGCAAIRKLLRMDGELRKERRGTASIPSIGLRQSRNARRTSNRQQCSRGTPLAAHMGSYAGERWQAEVIFRVSPPGIGEAF